MFPGDDLGGLPFAPGESPFQIKGVVYRGHLEYVEAHVPGGLKAVVANLRDDRLRAFYAQQFLAASWYDILPMVPAGRVCARMLGKSFADYLTGRARVQARKDLDGVYSVVMKLATPQSVAIRLPGILSRYFNFGRAEVKLVGDGAMEAWNTGMPAFLIPWYQPVVTAYAVLALTQAGARSPNVTIHPPEADGQHRGVDLVRLRWNVTWVGRTNSAPP